MRTQTSDIASPRAAQKSGWPWTGEFPELPVVMPDGTPWPRITVVTPSFNQGKYVEETIRSVLLQRYPNLEYFVMDGGSKDETVDVLRHYEPWLNGWVSEPDKGQSHAINKGLTQASGEILAYLNSDDIYMPYTFRLVAELFHSFPQVDWITGHHSYMMDGGVLAPSWHRRVYVFNQKLFQLGFHTAWFFGWIQQPSTFWRRSLFEKAGAAFDENCRLAMDSDMWMRMSRYSVPTYVAATLAAMRLHPEQKHYAQGRPYQEIEERAAGYGFLPLRVRKVLYPCLRTPLLRRVLRLAWCSGEGKRITWDTEAGAWTLSSKYVF